MKCTRGLISKDRKNQVCLGSGERQNSIFGSLPESSVKAELSPTRGWRNSHTARAWNDRLRELVLEEAESESRFSHYCPSRRCCISRRLGAVAVYDPPMGKSDYTFRYRVQNWPEYNRALIARGSLTFWFDEEAIGSWRHTRRSNHSGRPRLYSDTAIQCALVLAAVFHLSLRSTQGFLASLVELMALELPVPDYSTVSRRQGALEAAPRVRPGNGPRHIVIDSTGLKIYGAGEWYARKHRRGRRRTWRKLHVSVDETTKEIVAADITSSNVHDSRIFAALLDQVPGDIGQVSGDGAYDTRACYEAALERGAIVTIPPRRKAKNRPSSGGEEWRAIRNATLQQIRELGRYEWRARSSSTRQSLAENAMSRFKRLLGTGLSARGFDNQRTEAGVKCVVLNRMTSLGMPDSVRV